MSAPIPVRPGDEVSLATPDNGLRSYLAVRGGIDVPPVLGSRATDTMARLGPAALTPGCVLPVGTPSSHPPVDLAPQRPFPDELVLRVVPGPRLDWFAEDALTSLLSAPHRVTAEADRVGIRLDGPVLRRARATNSHRRREFSARCRFRLRATRSCSSPITRSPAATRCPPSCWKTTSTSPRRRDRASRSGSQRRRCR